MGIAAQTDAAAQRLCALLYSVCCVCLLKALCGAHPKWEDDARAQL